jgi:hypothetical protein
VIMTITDRTNSREKATDVIDKDEEEETT